MEFWPKKKQLQPSQPLVLERTFNTSDPANEEKINIPTLENANTPEEFLNSIDFKTLNDIFDALTQKSGKEINSKDLNYRLNPESIELDSTEVRGERGLTSRGEAYFFTGGMRLHWRNEEHYSMLARNIDLLQTLIHESTHIRGANQVSLHKSESDGSIEMHKKVGLLREERELKSEGDPVVTGVGLNEAVTEMISHEVLNSYLTRTGTSRYLKDEQVLKILKTGAYVSDRVALEVVMKVLVQETGTDRGTVWRGFVSAYMNGREDLHVLLSTIDEYFSENEEARKILTLLAANTHIDTVDDITHLEILTKPLKIENEKMEIMLRSVMPYDRRQLQNVLGLQ